MSTELYFAKDLIFKDLEFSSNVEALNFLSSKLYDKGYVKDGYKEAIIDREKEYPTALPSVDIKIAIPHANHTLVNKAAIAIGILKHPVEFSSMEDSDTKLKVQIVIMLALDEPHGHIKMLQNIVKLIQNPDALKAIIKASSIEEIMNTLQPYLIKK